MEEKIIWGLILLFFSALLFFMIKNICEKKTTDYFNANIKDKLSSMFDGYRKETLEHFQEIKDFKDFKRSEILICNDIKNIINDMAILSKFENCKNIYDISDDIKLSKFKIIILFADEEKSLEKWYKFIDESNSTTPILIYTHGQHNLTNLDLFKNRLYCPVTNQFTLLERLHSSYMINKIYNS
ncbi:hypothetical protein [Malaciobacter canalis]|uniref:hypothetical protein n=1 Tax=Malaciobacter canalis TaxID=1912871 RepID=UPI00384F5EF8